MGQSYKLAFVYDSDSKGSNAFRRDKARRNRQLSKARRHDGKSEMNAQLEAAAEAAELDRDEAICAMIGADDYDLGHYLDGYGRDYTQGFADGYAAAQRVVESMGHIWP